MYELLDASKKVQCKNLRLGISVDLVNLLVSEGFLPIVDKKGWTSVNVCLKCGKINCTDFCAVLLTQSSVMIQTGGDVCTVDAIMTNYFSLLATKIMIMFCISILLWHVNAFFFKFCNKMCAYFVSRTVGNFIIVIIEVDVIVIREIDKYTTHYHRTVFELFKMVWYENCRLLGYNNTQFDGQVQ